MVHLMDDLLARVEEEVRKDLLSAAGPKADFHKFAKDALDLDRIKEQWELIWKTCGVQPRPGQKLLEVGSGFGGFVSYASQCGLKPYGIEVLEERVSISRELLRRDGVDNVSIAQGVGERLPYPDNFFDFIYSSNVLEHVTSPEAVISESIRVLKPGGYLQFVIPNYGSWWEGHYGILWLPNLPKPLAKLYVRLYGRDSHYVDTLRLINRPWLDRIMDKHRLSVETISWGEEVWEARLRSLAFSGWATLGSLKNIVQLVHRLGLVEVVLWLGKRLHWETPFILTIRKR